MRIARKSPQWCIILTLIFAVGFVVFSHLSEPTVSTDKFKKDVAKSHSGDEVYTTAREHFTSRVMKTARTLNVLQRNDSEKNSRGTRAFPPSYLITSPNICELDLKGPVFLILVFSSPGNFKRRKIIRETWANKRIYKKFSIKTVFLMGTTGEKEDQAKIANETRRNGDIVQGSFIDGYKTTSDKGVMGYRWVSEYCQGASLVIKVDDEEFLNIYHVIQNIYGSHLEGQHLKMLCQVTDASPISQNGHRKSETESTVMARHPKFCQGSIVFFTPDLMEALYEAAQSTPVGAWADNVYLYGILPSVVKDIEFQDVSKNCSVSVETCLTQYESTSSVTYVMCEATDPDMMYRMWRHSLRRVSTQGRGLFSIQFIPALENFIRNYPKMENLFHRDTPPKVHPQATDKENNRIGVV